MPKVTPELQDALNCVLSQVDHMRTHFVPEVEIMVLIVQPSDLDTVMIVGDMSAETAISAVEHAKVVARRRML